jgi:hypothetical protein
MSEMTRTKASKIFSKEVRKRYKSFVKYLKKQQKVAKNDEQRASLLRFRRVKN